MRGKNQFWERNEGGFFLVLGDQPWRVSKTSTREGKEMFQGERKVGQIHGQRLVSRQLCSRREM